MKCALLILTLIFIFSCSKKELIKNEKESQYTIDLNIYNEFLDELSNENIDLNQSISSELKNISGSIINAETKAPIEKSKVYNVKGDLLAETNSSGEFSFDVKNINHQFIIKKDNYETRIISSYLQNKDGNVVVDEIELYQIDPNDITFVFAGDTAFSRRMFDPSGTTPFNQLPLYYEDSTININDPLPGTVEVLKYAKHIYKNIGDYKILNFESPIIEDEALPFYHKKKDFNFFSRKQSLTALKTELDIDYVSMGNNHVYDYLDTGLQNTLDALNTYGIPNSGAAFNSVDAFRAYEVEIKGSPFGLVSASTVTGDKHEINYMASETKGGSADYTNKKEDFDNEIANLLSRGIAPITQLHTGKEYTYIPTQYVRDQFQYAVDAGSKIVIGHHPHIAQGFGKINNTPVIYSLGNFVLDQDRLETMFGFVAILRYNPAVGIKQISGYPVYLEDYKPKPISGRLSKRIMKQLSEYSDDNVFVKLNHGRMQVYFNDETQTPKSRVLNLKAEAIIDLRDILKKGESLVSIEINGTSSVKYGRDILFHGDMEDYDIDDDTYEVERFNLDSSCAFSCFRAARNGHTGLCSVRHQSNQSTCDIAFKNSIRVIGDAIHEPNKDLSFIGYYKGDNSGAIKIKTSYYSSIDSNFYSSEDILNSNGGNFDWKKFTYDLNMPADNPFYPEDLSRNARAIRLNIEHSKTQNKPGIAMFDDFSIISWDAKVDLNNSSFNLKPVNAVEFLRILTPDKVSNIKLTISEY